MIDKMIQHLTESEKECIVAFRERGWEHPAIAADITVGSHLREFVHLHDEVEAYIREVER